MQNLLKVNLNLLILSHYSQYFKSITVVPHSAQQSRGGKKLFFEFYQILPKPENTYQIKAGYEALFKCDAYKHQKKHFKVAKNTACLPEAVIFEVKKGVKES